MTGKHGAEALDRMAPVAGEIRIADRGFARLPGLLRFRRDSAQGADFIVRIGWNALSLRQPDGGAFNLIGHLHGLPHDLQPHEVLVCARSGRLGEPVPLRLVIQRKPPDAAEAARKQQRQQATRQQKVLKPGSLVAAGYVVLATSLPAEGYAAPDILAAYRLRWQIELAFKRLKSLLHIDAIPTRTDRASRSWLYAHLIMALLCDDLTQDFLDASPSGPA